MLNSRCRFDPYAQQKLEQREAAIKKFYKDEDGAADDEEAGEVAEEMQEAKETEGQGSQRKPAGASSTGENSAPPLSSVFEEEDVETEGDGEVLDAIPHTVVEDTMARVNEVAIEEREAEEKTSNEETADTEMKTNESTGAAENNETLKLVLEDTLALVEDENQALNDTVEEKENEEDGNVEEKKVDGEEESLKLVLEPDTPIEEEEEIILSSQVGGNIVNLESL